MVTDGLDRTRLRRAAPVVCWSVLVAVASVLPASGGVGVSDPGPFGVGVDKWLHLGAYWAVAFLAAAGLRTRGWRTLAFAVAFAVGLGAGLELVQATLPARAFDPADAAVNGVGAVLGAATYALRRRTTRAGDRTGDGG